MRTVCCSTGEAGAWHPVRRGPGTRCGGGLAPGVLLLVQFLSGVLSKAADELLTMIEAILSVSTDRVCLPPGKTGRPGDSRAPVAGGQWPVLVLRPGTAEVPGS